MGDSFIYMAEDKTTAVVKNNDVGGQVIARIEQLCQVGFVMPKDFNYVNAIKASMMVLQELKDKDGKLATEVCTPVSIQQALFKMCVGGLDASKKQCYFIVRGTQLCYQESYFGKALQVKRIFPNWEPLPRVVYKGDDFAFTTDIKTGRRVLLRHEQTLESLDADFVGAYLYLPCKDGGQDLYVMSKREILAAWSKSSSSQQLTHKTFPVKMIGKTVVNSGCNMIINSTPELADVADEEFAEQYQPIDIPAHEVQEVNVDEIPVAELQQIKASTPEAKPLDPNVQDF